MLCLTRRPVPGQDKIQIGDGITITLIRTGERFARIGIDAPEGTRIWRAELLEKEGAGAMKLEGVK